MSNLGRTDKMIIGGALGIFLIALLFLFGDGLLFGGIDRFRGEPIGFISDTDGDVRFKATETISWNSARKNQNLIYNDAVFVGKGSRATARLGNSKLDIKENSLVVFRKENDSNFLDINFGQIFGKISPGEKIIIDNGQGAPIELSSDQASEIVFNKSKAGEIEIKVKSGNAKVSQGGKKVELKQDVVFKPDPAPVVAIEPVLPPVQPEPEPVAALPEEPTPLELPIIQRPVAQELIKKDKPEQEVIIELKKPETAEYVWYKVFKGPEFKHPVANISHPGGTIFSQLQDGDYRIQAVAVYKDKALSAWTEPVDFKVETKATPHLKLSQAELRNFVEVPNKDYPTELYSGSEKNLGFYLSTADPQLSSHFESTRGQVQIKSGGQIHNVKGKRWPASLAKPGIHNYQYRSVRPGLLPSNWSEEKQLEISMEAPRKTDSSLLESPSEFNVMGRTQVDWTPVLFADQYEVSLKSENDETDTKIYANAPSTAFSMAANTSYQWKVRALDKNGQAISGFSNLYEEKIRYQAPTPPPPLAKRVKKPVRRIASKEEQQLAIKEKIRIENKKYEPSGFWGWLGSGYNYTNYKQNVGGIGQFDDNNLAGPSMYGEVGYKHGNSGIAGVLSYKSTPGEVRLKDTNLQGAKYNWTTIGLEGLFEKEAPFSLLRSTVYYGPRIGVQDHQLPYIHQEDTDVLALKKIHMQTASLGFFTRVKRDRVGYLWSMRYQYPFSQNVEGVSNFDVKTKFAFDGSVGITYNLTEQWMLGWFWYGQWHEYDLSFIENGTAFSGSQSLFYSNMDFRLGFDF